MAGTFSSPPERESSGASKQYPLSKIAAYFSFGRAGSFSGKKQRGENVAREVAITVGQNVRVPAVLPIYRCKAITIDHVGTEPIALSHFLVKFASFGEFSSFLF